MLPPQIVELGVRVIVVSDCRDEFVRSESIRVGASDYLSKDSASSELVAAVRGTVAGMVTDGQNTFMSSRRLHSAVQKKSHLSIRERRIIQLIVEGRTTKEIADLLGIAIRTAEHCRDRLMKKIGIKGVAGLTLYAVRRGLVRV